MAYQATTDDSYRRYLAENDLRFPRLKTLLRKAGERAANGWYVDVYRDDEDDTLHVSDRCSTGFKTHPRQDGLYVLHRCVEEHGGTWLENEDNLHEAALECVLKLRDDESRKS